MTYSLYFHVPFCKHRCHYCDFITYAGMESLIPEYFDALIKELRLVLQNVPRIDVQSIYFGGGTPSIVPISIYEKLLVKIEALCELQEDCEISLEANPGTLSYDYLQGLHRLRFSRLSLGVQSMNNLDLSRLDRIHTVEDVLMSFNNARLAGFTNISLDLIFGLPGQTLAGWEESLKRAIMLAPQHFSLYALIIEPGTLFHQWYQKGLLALQDQDLEGDMFETAMDLLFRDGYEQYEISNWTKIDSSADFRCRHNMQYWLNQPYLGLGVGAHGFAGCTRTKNTPVIPDYIHRMNDEEQIETRFPLSPATIAYTEIDAIDQMKEFMMMGLRLVKTGVSNARFEKAFGKALMDVFGDQIKELLASGLIECFGKENDNYRLSKLGVMLGNQVFMEFV